MGRNDGEGARKRRWTYVAVGAAATMTCLGAAFGIPLLIRELKPNGRPAPAWMMYGSLGFVALCALGIWGSWGRVSDDVPARISQFGACDWARVQWPKYPPPGFPHHGGITDAGRLGLRGEVRYVRQSHAGASGGWELTGAWRFVKSGALLEQVKLFNSEISEVKTAFPARAQEGSSSDLKCQCDEQNRVRACFGLVEYDYHPNGVVKREVNFSEQGPVSVFEFNENGELIRMFDPRTPGTGEARYSYQRDAVGNWTQKSWTVTGVDNPCTSSSGTPVACADRREISYFGGDSYTVRVPPDVLSECGLELGQPVTPQTMFQGGWLYLGQGHEDRYSLFRRGPCRSAVHDDRVAGLMVTIPAAGAELDGKLGAVADYVTKKLGKPDNAVGAFSYGWGGASSGSVYVEKSEGSDAIIVLAQVGGFDFAPLGGQKEPPEPAAAASDEGAHELMATFSCTVNEQPYPLVMCLDDTNIKVRTAGTVTVLNRLNQVVTGNFVHVKLRRPFEIEGQNSSEVAILTVRITDSRGGVLYEDKAGQFGVIAARD